MYNMCVFHIYKWGVQLVVQFALQTWTTEIKNVFKKHQKKKKKKKAMKSLINFGKDSSSFDALVTYRRHNSNIGEIVRQSCKVTILLKVIDAHLKDWKLNA